MKDFQGLASVNFIHYRKGHSHMYPLVVRMLLALKGNTNIQAGNHATLPPSHQPGVGGETEATFY